ncbi:hypothetical protein SO694_00044033 [Aureococcus anophagefferens]|uniref:Uncharacterized protein n=1 Tax=Aureococcus anophagefferens TaxID=44056 RepID=A0ABR1G729_AURAN
MGPPQPARDPDRGRRRLLKSQSDAALAAKRKSHQERAAALVGTRDLAWHLRRSQVQADRASQGDRSPRSLDSADPFVVDASRDDATRSPRSVVVVGRLVGRTIDALGAGDYGTAAASQPRPYAVEALLDCRANGLESGSCARLLAACLRRASLEVLRLSANDVSDGAARCGESSRSSAPRAAPSWTCSSPGRSSSTRGPAGGAAAALAVRAPDLGRVAQRPHALRRRRRRRAYDAYSGVAGAPAGAAAPAPRRADGGARKAVRVSAGAPTLARVPPAVVDGRRGAARPGGDRRTFVSGFGGADVGAALGLSPVLVKLAEAKAAPESDDDDDDDDARRRRHKEKESMTTQEARERTSQLLADRIFAEASYERKLERDKKTFRVDFAAFLPYWHLVQYGSGKKANRAYTHLLSTLKHVLRILRLSGPEARARSTSVKLRRLRQFSDVVGLSRDRSGLYAPLVADVYVSVLRRALDGRGRALDVLLDVVPTPAGAPAPDKERVKEKPRGCRMTAADVRTALFGKDATKDAATWDAPLFKRLAFDDLLRTLWLRADALSDEGDATLDDVLELALDFAFECAASAQEKLVQRFEDEEHAKGKVDWYAFDLILDDFDMGPGDGTVEGEAASKAEKLELFKEALGVDELEEQDLVLTDAKRFAMTLWKAGKFKQLRKHEVVAEAPVEAVVERPRGLTNGNLGLALRVLDLSWNRLHVADELRVLVSVCPNLEVLDASYNSFGDGGVVAILAAADFSPEPSNFVALKLRGNGVGPRGAHLLGDLVRRRAADAPRLELLDLASNRLGAFGAGQQGFGARCARAAALEDGGGVFEARPLALDMDDCAVDADVPSDGSVPPTYDPDDAERAIDDAPEVPLDPATTAPDVGVALRNALRAVARDNALRFESLEWCRMAASGNERRDERERTWLPVKLLTRAGAMPSVGHTRSGSLCASRGGHAPSPPYLKLDLEDPANELFLKTNPNAAPLGDRAFVEKLLQRAGHDPQPPNLCEIYGHDDELKERPLSDLVHLLTVLLPRVRVASEKRVALEVRGCGLHERIRNVSFRPDDPAKRARAEALTRGKNTMAKDTPRPRDVAPLLRALLRGRDVELGAVLKGGALTFDVSSSARPDAAHATLAPRDVVHRASNADLPTPCRRLVRAFAMDDDVLIDHAKNAERASTYDRARPEPALEAAQKKGAKKGRKGKKGAGAPKDAPKAPPKEPPTAPAPAADAAAEAAAPEDGKKAAKKKKKKKGGKKKKGASKKASPEKPAAPEPPASPPKSPSKPATPSSLVKSSKMWKLTLGRGVRSKIGDLKRALIRRFDRNDRCAIGDLEATAREHFRAHPSRTLHRTPCTPDLLPVSAQDAALGAASKWVENWSLPESWRTETGDKAGDEREFDQDPDAVFAGLVRPKYERQARIIQKNWRAYRKRKKRRVDKKPVAYGHAKVAGCSPVLSRVNQVVEDKAVQDAATEAVAKWKHRPKPSLAAYLANWHVIHFGAARSACHPKGIAAVLAAPHADTVEGHLVPLQDVVVALVGYDKRVVAEDPTTWTSPLAALARPWLDEETMYDLFLKIRKTQAFLRTELANWLSVDGRLTFDDFKRFFPDLPGAAAVSSSPSRRSSAAVQDRADTNDPAYVERKPPKVEATAKKHHMFAQLDGLEFAELEHITKGTVD